MSPNLPLIDLYLDDLADAGESAQVERLLVTDADFAAMFARCALVHALMIERTQAAVTDAVATPPRPPYPISKIENRKPQVRAAKSKLSFALAAALLLAACGVAITAIALNHPQSEIRDPKSPIAPVATLIESTGATVRVNDTPANEGAEYAAGTYAIEAGSAEFLLTNKVAVKLTGPTALTLHSNMSATLTRGSATFDCPPKAHGFTVHLPGGAKVVDLGTRFIVHVRENGNAAVVVLEGEVELNGRRIDGHDPVARRLVAGRIVAWDHATGQLADLASSSLGFDDPTEREVDLIDLVAGGDGRGHARHRGIDPITGHADLADEPRVAAAAAPGVYRTLDDRPMIDGVFVPSDSSDGVPVDSLGHRFDGFDGVGGECYSIIWSGIPPSKRADPGALGDSVDYRARGDRQLWMHSNKAITFDLDAIEVAHGGSVRTFRAGALYLTPHDRIPPARRVNGRLTADVWVLVDGRPRFVRRRFDATDGLVRIELELTPSDRMLTLAVTDGGDGLEYDWVVLDEPTVVLSELPYTSGAR